MRRWERLQALTTATFSVWLFTFMMQNWLPTLLADGSRRLGRALDVGPVVREQTTEALVSTVVEAGLPLSVILFLLSFALFHRASEAESNRE